MLKTEYRLKKRSAFKATYKTGKTFYFEGLTVFCGKEKTNDYTTKIGFVVSKKIHKRAVKRNRIKRLMREACRLYIKNNGLNSPYMSLIFVASSKLLEKDYNYINKCTVQLLSKVTND